MSCQCCKDNRAAKELCVAKVPIFNHLSVDEMRQIAAISIQKQYQKREFIFRADEPLEHLYIIHKGNVKIYRLSDSGKEQLIRILGPGDFTGEYALFSETNSTYYAEVLEDAEICMIFQKDLHELLMHYPSISLKLMKELSTRLNQAECMLEEVSVQDVESRTASYLVHLAKKHGATKTSTSLKVTLPLSKKDLASHIGTSRETLSRKLSVFQRRGWIRLVGQRDIIILNFAELHEKAEV